VSDSGILEAEVTPRWPYRLPRRGSGNGTMRARDGVVSRLLCVGAEPIVAHAWQVRSGEVRFRLSGDAPAAELEVALERMRFMLGVDDDLSEFFAEFKRDPVLGPGMRRRPWIRPRRRPWPWEALSGAIAGQLIEASRAAAIERRMVRRWGRAVLAPSPHRSGWLREMPRADVVADRAPAELTGMDLSGGRSIAMIRCAREVAAGRVDLTRPAHDERLLRIREIGPWTVQCLGFHGRGEPDSLPAGDLAYVKLVGRLTGMRRRATVDEVEEYFERFRPFRALAGIFAAMHYHSAVQTGPPLRLAA
jgi:3-methyladenine DNA glycosylase/8-oxoguanine DNA glycosylase